MTRVPARCGVAVITWTVLLCAALPASAQFNQVVQNSDGGTSVGSWRDTIARVGPAEVVGFSNIFQNIGLRTIVLDGDVMPIVDTGVETVVRIDASFDASGNELFDMLVTSDPIEGADPITLLELGDDTAVRILDLDFGKGEIVLGDVSVFEIDATEGRTTTISSTIVGDFATIVVDADRRTVGTTGTVVLDADTAFGGTTILAEGRLVIDTDAVQGDITLENGLEFAPLLVFDQLEGTEDDDTIDTVYRGVIRDGDGTDHPGAVDKEGEGMLEFLEDQEYSGTFVVRGGRVKGPVGAFPTGLSLLAGPGAEAPLEAELTSGCLALGLDACDVLGGNLTGEGTVTIKGSSATIVSLENANSGSSAIDLIVDSAIVRGEASNFPPTITLQGSLPLLDFTGVIFDQEEDGSYAGVISGATGGIYKDGPGTLTLTGANDFQAGILVNQGTLRGSTGSLPTVGPINVAAGATLDLNQSGNGTWNGSTLGAGKLRKSGSGTVQIGVDQAVGEGVEVAGGSLLVADQALTNTVDVLSDGAFGGTGTLVGDLTNNGNVNPGALLSASSIAEELGTLTVQGDVAFEPDSALRVTAIETLGASLLSVDGNVDIDSTATIDDDDRLVGDFFEPTLFPVLDWTGSLTGRFDESTLGTPFLAGSLCYGDDPSNDIACGSVTGRTVFLLIQETGLTLDFFAQTTNEARVGRALDKAFEEAVPGSDMANVRAAVRGAKEGQRGFLISQTAELITQTQTVRLAADRQLTQMLGRRLATRARGTMSDVEAFFGGPAQPISDRGALPPLGAGLGMPHDVLPRIAGGASDAAHLGLGVWTDGYAVFGDLKGDAGNGADYRIYGFAAGADYEFGPGLLAGGAFGYARSDLDFVLDDSTGDGNTWYGALYGGVDRPRYYAGAAFTASYSSMETHRRIQIGVIDRTAESHPRGYTVGGHFEGGLNAWQVADVAFQPTAGLRLTYLVQNGMDERGAQSLNLRIEEQTMLSIVPEAGLRIFTRFQVDDDYLLIPELRMGYEYEAGDRDIEFTAQLVGAIDPLSFRIEGQSADRGRGTLGAGWTVSNSNGLNAYVGYDARLSRNLVEHVVGLGVGLNW